MIVCAAIKFKKNKDGNEIILSGRRHNDILKMLEDLDEFYHVRMVEDGFITHKGIFLNRRQAYEHAVICGQLSKAQIDGWTPVKDELYSEDLY